MSEINDDHVEALPDAPRDARGHFLPGPRPGWAKGRRGGRKPGIPSLRHHIADMIESGDLPIEKRLSKVVNKLFEMSEEGSVEAMKLLFAYLDNDPKRGVANGMTIVVQTGVPLPVEPNAPSQLLQVEEVEEA